jgi:ADP-L-glycero-D-manno-heptose 6-epimerase
MGATCIVTGGAGFIGANVVAALNARGQADILVVDHLNSDLKRRNLEAVRCADYVEKDRFRQMLRGSALPTVRVVYHLGACSATTETDERYIMDNNYAYTRELCEWALARGARFVYASSAATYGDGSRGYSDDDAVTTTLEPLNLYGQSKHRFDLWALERGLFDRIAGLKYFNVYGPREDHKGDMRSVVNKAYGQIAATGELTLFRSHRPDYADGHQERDFVYVRDAVDVTLFFGEETRASGLFNCGTGRARTWLDLAHAAFAAMARPPRILFADMPLAIRDKYQYHTQADVRKLRGAGYGRPFTTIEEGVADYVRTYLAVRPPATAAG